MAWKVRDRVRACAFVFVVLLCNPLFAAQGGSTDYPELGREVVEIVREHFLDVERAEAWATRHADYAGDVRDGATFATRTSDALSRLETSHTDYYPRGSATYWGLLAIFAESLGVEEVTYESIGVDVNDRGFVRRVLAGGPAERAGMLRGDRIVVVDGQPYEPVGTFEGRAETPVVLTIERVADGKTQQISVVPRRISPMQEWLTAQDEGARVLTRDGVDVAYVPLLWCVGEEVANRMSEWIAERFRDAHALILDFRDGWGGCNSDFLNYFNTAPPVLTLIDREGEERSYDPQWRKPLFVLVNGGTRSGKEVVAHALQRHGRARLVGERTAGFVVGGRPFLLSDRSLLYVAVMDALVDGERLEGVGVAPDVVVPDRLEYAAGTDAQLERAVALAVKQAREPTADPADQAAER
jgi:carboxyl-terminal processing protease